MYYNTDSTKYFSWGDTIGQNKNGTESYSFSKDNYNAGKCGSGHNLSGDLPQGDSTYDAATANMGSRWKMPTKDQWQELIDGTNSEWVTLNGVNGRIFIFNKDSKYIFLPAGGYWDRTTLWNVSNCYYWTTKRNVSSTVFIIEATSSSISASYTGNPYYGLYVRAIQ